MTPPKARCVTCMNVIQSHDPTKTHQRPKYCDNPECRTTYLANPICLRCRGPMPDRKHGQRYHEDCRLGCHYCGGLFNMPNKGSVREFVLEPIYCTRECRDLAWAEQPLPTCPVCEEPVKFGGRKDGRDDSKVPRNPPAYHHECRPDSRRAKVALYTERNLEWAQFHANYTARHRAAYQPFDPRFTPPRPPHVPQDLELLCADPTPQPYEFEWDEPSRGSCASDWYVDGKLPGAPLYERAEPYNDEWNNTYDDDGELVPNPYLALYVPLTPWAEEGQARSLNPTHKL